MVSSSEKVVLNDKVSTVVEAKAEKTFVEMNKLNGQAGAQVACNIPLSDESKEQFIGSMDQYLFAVTRMYSEEELFSLYKLLSNAKEANIIGSYNGPVKAGVNEMDIYDVIDQYLKGHHDDKLAKLSELLAFLENFIVTPVDTIDGWPAFV